MVPNHTSVAREMELITTRDQLRTRVSQLRRILKGVRPANQDVVTLPTGQTAPRWFRDEVRRAHRLNQRNREELRVALYPDWEDMSGAQRATAQADKNIAPLDEEETYYTPRGLDDLTRERYLNDYVYMSQYLDVWAQFHSTNPGYQFVVDTVRELVRDNPGFLRRVLEEDHDEATPEYLYPEFGSRRVSAYREPFAQRSNNVVRFWQRVRERAGRESVDVESRGWIDEQMVADLGVDDE